MVTQKRSQQQSQKQQRRSWKQASAQLNQAIVDRQTAGDALGEAVLRSQRAALLTMRQDWAATLADFTWLADLAKARQRPADEAKARLALAKASQNCPDQASQTRAAFARAVKLYCTLEHWPNAAKAWQDWAQCELGASQYQGAIACLTQAIDTLQPVATAADASELLPLLADLYGARAGAYPLISQLAAAEADLATAIALAQQVGDRDRELRWQLQRQNLTTAETPQAQISDLLQQAQDLQNFDVQGNLHLQQAQTAMLSQDWPAAIEHAEAAIAAAKQSTQPTKLTHYLIAALTIAQAREVQQDWVGTLAVLLRCKVYLEGHLGPPAGQAINQVLDTYKQRWGHAKTAQVIRDYQAYIQQHGPQTV